MKALLVAIIILRNSKICCAEAFDSNKEWEFPVDDGVVKIRLTGNISTIDREMIYSLQIIGRNAQPSLQTEVEILKVVTQDMEEENMLPQRITDIILEIREPDISKQLSVSAYNSKIWANAKKEDFGEAIVKILNSTKAYSSFDKIFNKYGLEVKVSHAEYISLIKPEQIGFKSDTVSALPSKATLVLTLHKIGERGKEVDH